MFQTALNAVVTVEDGAKLVRAVEESLLVGIASDDAVVMNDEYVAAFSPHDFEWKTA